MRETGSFKTEAAYVGSIIKNELKAKFPKVKFSIKSQTYSGGDSLNVRFTATKETIGIYKEVKSIASKYEAGRFDGMTDMYEYTNKTEGPTVKYLFVDMNTDEMKKEYLPTFLKEWGLTEEEFNTANHVYNTRLGEWSSQKMHREFNREYNIS